MRSFLERDAAVQFRTMSRLSKNYRSRRGEAGQESAVKFAGLRT